MVYHSQNFGSESSCLFLLQAAPRTGADESIRESDLKAALDVLRVCDLHNVVEEWFTEVLQMDLQRNITPEFWNGINQQENAVQEQECAILLLDTFRLLVSRLEPYLKSLDILGRWADMGFLHGSDSQMLRDKVFTMFKAILFFSTSKNFQNMVQQFYSRTFKIYMRQKRRGDDSVSNCESSMNEQESDCEDHAIEDCECAGCESPKDQCWCSTAMEQFQHLNSIL